MKKVKFEGKLNLNKETIAKLNQDEINSIKGGATYPCFVKTGACPVITTIRPIITTTFPTTNPDTTYVTGGNLTGGGFGL